MLDRFDLWIILYKYPVNLPIWNGFSSFRSNSSFNILFSYLLYLIKYTINKLAIVVL